MACLLLNNATIFDDLWRSYFSIFVSGQNIEICYLHVSRLCTKLLHNDQMFCLFCLIPYFITIEILQGRSRSRAAGETAYTRSLN